MDEVSTPTTTVGPGPWLVPRRGSYDAMTALDAGFLAIEQPDTPMHVGSLSIFDGAPFRDGGGVFRLDDVRDRVAERLHLLPRFRQRVATAPWGAGRPIWVDDGRFDVADHVRLVHLSAPGTRAQLAELCCELQARRLDRRRPLWELCFVDGLEDGSVALIERVHHAMVDGVSGVDVAAALLDLEPDPPPMNPPPWRPRPAPHRAQLLTRAQLELWREPAEWLQVGCRTARHLAGMPAATLQRAVGALDAVGSAAGGRPQLRVLRGHVGPGRRLDWVTVDLAEVAESGHRHGATVNDVVLAAVAGAVRSLLVSRGIAPGGRTLHVLVPVSTRAVDQRGELGNRVTAILAPVPLDAATPAERLERVRASMTTHKRRHQSDGVQRVLGGLELLPHGVMSVLARTTVRHQPTIDLVVTNVPGPAEPLYFLGAELRESVPIVPLAGNLTIGIAVLSYHQQLTIGVFGDSGHAHDVERLTRALRSELAAFATLV
jgi:WS/DGAT/MGAT family acyltransferase